MFLTPLRMEKYSKSEYVLLEPLEYVDDTYHIIAQAGFVFDGASIPKILWSVIGSPFTGEYTEAACIHDILYQSCILPRWESDALFKTLMEVTHTGKTKRNTMWFGVRIGGWYSIRQYTPKTIENAKNHLTLIKYIDGVHHILNNSYPKT